MIVTSISHSTPWSEVIAAVEANMIGNNTFKETDVSWHGPYKLYVDEERVDVSGLEMVFADQDVEAVEREDKLRSLREKRDSLLSESDWTQMPDIPEATRTLWQTYRQALRDLPSTTADPANPVWPTKPV